ncbi:MAG: hypothetical protein IKV87_05080 [Methanobrevibacter sp.]|nr:hypothetical protein [Methanobrevibacter sp.]
METKNLIIICATIIILVCLGLFIMSNMNSQEETHITVLTSQYLTEGDTLKLKLCDKDSKGIANQNIKLKIESKDGTVNQEISITTNDKGECQIENFQRGNYTLFAKYDGTSQYKGYSLNYEFVVKAPEVQTSSTTTSTSTSNSNSNDDYASDFKEDDVIDGWDPSEHEVSREDLGDGEYRVTYDDGYHRVVDKDGNVLSYGY